jgi:hypothetical protein
MPSGLTRGWDPVRQGEPLFADKDVRQQENLQRILFILDHSVIQYEQDALWRYCFVKSFREQAPMARRFDAVVPNSGSDGLAGCRAAPCLGRAGSLDRV